MKNPSLALLLAAALAATPAWAHRPAPASELSAVSMLPVAVSVAAPAVLLSGTAVLTAKGSEWVLERASDGARLSLQLSGDLAQGAVVASGAAVVVTAVAAGWVLSSAGRVLCFVPNDTGRRLTHHERVTR